MVLSKTGLILLIVFGVVFVLAIIIIPSVLIPLLLHKDDESSSSHSSSSHSSSDESSSDTPPIYICEETNTVSGVVAVGNIGNIDVARRGSAVSLIFPDSNGDMSVFVPGQSGTLRQGTRLNNSIFYGFTSVPISGFSFLNRGQVSFSEDGLSVAFVQPPSPSYVYVSEREDASSSTWENKTLKEISGVTGFNQVCISGNGNTVIASRPGPMEPEPAGPARIFIFERYGTEFLETGDISLSSANFGGGHCTCMNSGATRCVLVSRTLQNTTAIIVAYRSSTSEQWQGFSNSAWKVLPDIPGPLVNVIAILKDNDTEESLYLQTLGVMLFLLSDQKVYIYNIESPDDITMIGSPITETGPNVAQSITVSGLNCVDNLFITGPSNTAYPYVIRYKYMRDSRTFEKQNNIVFSLYNTPRVSISVNSRNDGDYLLVVTTPPDSSTQPCTANILKTCPEIPALNTIGNGQVDAGSAAEWQALTCVVFAEGKRTLVLNEENTISEGTYNESTSLYIY